MSDSYDRSSRDGGPCSSREGNTDGCDRAEGMDKATCSSTVSNSYDHSSRDGGPCSSTGGNTDHFDPGEHVSNLNDTETGMGARALLLSHLSKGLDPL